MMTIRDVYNVDLSNFIFNSLKVFSNPKVLLGESKEEYDKPSEEDYQPVSTFTEEAFVSFLKSFPSLQVPSSNELDENVFVSLQREYSNFKDLLLKFKEEYDPLDEENYQSLGTFILDNGLSIKPNESSHGPVAFSLDDKIFYVPDLETFGMNHQDLLLKFKEEYGVTDEGDYQSRSLSDGSCRYGPIHLLKGDEAIYIQEIELLMPTGDDIILSVKNKYQDDYGLGPIPPEVVKNIKHESNFLKEKLKDCFKCESYKTDFRRSEYYECLIRYSLSANPQLATIFGPLFKDTWSKSDYYYRKDTTSEGDYYYHYLHADDWSVIDENGKETLRHNCPYFD